MIWLGPPFSWMVYIAVSLCLQSLFRPAEYFKVGLVAAGLSLWACVLTTGLVLPVPLWISVINIVVPVLELVVLAALSYKALKPPQTPLAGPWLVISYFVSPTLFALFVLSVANLSTPDIKDCLAASSWDRFFRSKDEAAIRSVQEGLRCCGFNSLQDRAWPFPSRDAGVDACQQRLGFLVPCAPLWLEKTDVASILGALVSILNMILTNLLPKIIPYIPSQHHSPIDDSEGVRQSLLGPGHGLSREVVETLEEEERRRAERL